MESQFTSLGAINKLSKITRILSESPSKRMFDGFKSINDIHKSDLKRDLSHKYFGSFADPKLNSEPESDPQSVLLRNELKSILKNKQLFSEIKTQIDSKECPKESKFKDQSVQTDVREFAKIKVMSESHENASNCMQFAEEFIEELEFQCFKNSMNLTPITIYRNDSQTNISSNISDIYSFEETLSQSDSSNDKVNLQIHTSNEISELMTKYSINQMNGQMNSSTPRLIFDSKIIEYEADNCQNYEFGEEVIPIQFNGSQYSTNTDLKFANKPKSRFGSEEKSIEWMDLVKLIKQSIYKI